MSRDFYCMRFSYPRSNHTSPTSCCTCANCLPKYVFKWSQVVGLFCWCSSVLVSKNRGTPWLKQHRLVIRPFLLINMIRFAQAKVRYDRVSSNISTLEDSQLWYWLKSCHSPGCVVVARYSVTCHLSSDFYSSGNSPLDDKRLWWIYILSSAPPQPPQSSHMHIAAVSRGPW